MFLDQKSYCLQNLWRKNLPNNLAEWGGGNPPAFLRKKIRKTVFQRLLLKDSNIKNRYLYGNSYSIDEENLG